MRITQKEIEKAVHDGNVNLLLMYFERVEITEYEYHNERHAELYCKGSQMIDRKLLKKSSSFCDYSHTGSRCYSIEIGNVKIYITVMRIVKPWEE